jgi:hypothetical protein
MNTRQQKLSELNIFIKAHEQLASISILPLSEDPRIWVKDLSIEELRKLNEITKTLIENMEKFQGLFFKNYEEIVSKNTGGDKGNRSAAGILPKENELS